MFIIETNNSELYLVYSFLLSTHHALFRKHASINLAICFPSLEYASVGVVPVVVVMELVLQRFSKS